MWVAEGRSSDPGAQSRLFKLQRLEAQALPPRAAPILLPSAALLMRCCGL